MRYIYDEANRPVCRLEGDKKHGICRGQVYRYGDSCPLSMEELYPSEDVVKRHNALLMGCESLGDYTGEGFEQKMCRENPERVLYYHGKKAEGIYRSLEAVYHDLSVFVPEAEKALAYGEEGSDYLVREYSHDFRGNLLKESDTLGNRRSYRYDSIGRLTGTRDACGNETVFIYDSLGRLETKRNGEGETEYRLTYDALGRITARTDGEGNTTGYTYHPTGRVETVTGPDGAVDYHTEYDIWGRPESATDGMGNVTCYEKDSWGRVTKVTMPDGGIERYSYDYAGNIISAVDALGRETVFNYRGDNRVESIRKADGAVKYFGYDAEGRCNYRLDENCSLIRTLYNMDSNPVDMAGSKGADLQAVLQGDMPSTEPEIRSVYTYDEQGFLTSASEGGTINHYTRDSEGRVLTKSAWGKTLYANSYDADGRLSKLTTGAGTSTYSYDKAGRLAKVTADNGISAEYRYNSNGMQTGVLYGNGLKTEYRYGSRSQLVGMKSGFEGQTPFLQATYAYDGNGNRTAKAEQFQHLYGTQSASVLTEYSYDSMNRLTGETRDGELTAYAYDLVGNRTAKTASGRTESYLYNSRNQLTEIQGLDSRSNYRYDAAGNLITQQNYVENVLTKQLVFSYDTYNRTDSINGTCSTEADFTQRNHYDAEGYRYALEENGKVTNFVYRGGMLVSELDEEKNVSRGYVLGNEYIAQSQVTQLNGNLAEHSYYITDEQGSIRYVLNADGKIQNSYQYGAFGETLLKEESVLNRLRYNAQIEDALTGLYYLRARYYNPTTGRFTQEDVIYNDGLNLYAYCNSNPVMYCDPSGLAKVPCDEKVGGENAGSDGRSNIDLPEYDDKTTHGVLVLDDGTQVRFTSGDGDPRYTNYANNGHVEQKAAVYMNDNSIVNGTLYHNNTNGTCGFCNNMTSTFLPEGATLTVIPPANAIPNNSRAIAVPKTYVGNDKTPKVSSRYKGE